MQGQPLDEIRVRSRDQSRELTVGTMELSTVGNSKDCLVKCLMACISLSQAH